MMRSLFSAVTGLKNHQTRMDVIGNNVANVNTVGYKASRTTFKDIFSQTIAPAAGASTNVGGINPMQVGLGMTISTIDTLHTKSASQYTGNTLDLMIQGDGFFIAKNEMGEEVYTRAGNFYLDNEFNLVTADGFHVLGLAVASQPTVDNTTTPPTVTAATYATAKSSMQMKLSDTDNNTYYNINVDQNGVISGLVREVGTSNPVTGLAAGDKVVFGKLQLAGFNNQAGLEKIGNNYYRKSNNSGAPIESDPGVKGNALIKAGVLEMSNVDLANEFTDMIVTQRGFQANSRIITVSDTLLEELVNLKR